MTRDDKSNEIDDRLEDGQNDRLTGGNLIGDIWGEKDTTDSPGPRDPSADLLNQHTTSTPNESDDY